MAGELKIRAGTKLRMALDVPIGEQPKFNLICTFVKSLDVASFLISIPMVDGKPMPIDERRKLLIRYGTDKDAMIVAGYADDVVKEGIRRCWKIRRVAEQRQFFQRADERLKVTIPITYSQPTWRPDSEGNIRPEEGLTLDISAGGLASYVGDAAERGRGVRSEPACHRHRQGRPGHHGGCRRVLEPGGPQGQPLPVCLRLSVPLCRYGGAGADAELHRQSQEAV